MTDAPGDRTVDDADGATGADDVEVEPSSRDDDATESPSIDDSGPAGSADSTGLGRWRSREVEVPMRVYKTVTVFATLIAVVSVLAGFVLLDIATDRASLPLSEIDAVVALVGIAAMVFGAGTYAFSTRFRATGMGKPNTDGGQSNDDE